MKLISDAFIGVVVAALVLIGNVVIGYIVERQSLQQPVQTIVVASNSVTLWPMNLSPTGTNEPSIMQRVGR